MYDLRIDLADSEYAAAEVTACADPQSIETWNLMNGGDHDWLFPELRGGWVVTVSASARVQSLRSELPELLRDLERERITQTTLRNTPEWVTSRCRRLRVATAFQGGTDRPGSVYLTIELPTERSGGLVPSSGDSIAAWIGDFLRQPQQQDVLDKLRRSGFRQRHAFVFVPGFTAAPWPVPFLLTSEQPPLPTIAPQLPPEVTHIWVASTWSTASGVYWSPDTGWAHFSKQLRP